MGPKALLLASLLLASCGGNQAHKNQDRLGGPDAKSTAGAGPAAQATTANTPGAVGPIVCHHDEIYVSNHTDGSNQDYLGSSATVYSRTASGNVAPLRSIAGPTTVIYTPVGIAVDVVNDELDVLTTQFQFNVYSRSASGNIAPLRRPQLQSATGTPTTGSLTGIALDTVHDEIAISNDLGSQSSISFYSRAYAGGAATPLRTITAAPPGINDPFGVAIDAANDELFVANEGGSIAVFSRTASGNVAPLRTITVVEPLSIAVDAVNNELVTTSGSSVVVFARTASGSASPLRTITGASTGLKAAVAVAIDNVNDEIVVADEGSFSTPNAGAIFVFARTASGNVAPLRTISGASTGLNVPSGVAVSSDLAGSCDASSTCASFGCMPPGSVDCNEGHYCPAGTACNQSGSQTSCVAISGGTACPGGAYCPAGTDCAVIGCLPPGSVDCANGYYCAAGSMCFTPKSIKGNNATVCLVVNGQPMCTDGSYCPTGTACAAVGCVPAGAVDCNNGYYCSAGMICAVSGGQPVCNSASSGGPGGNSFDGSYTGTVSACGSSYALTLTIAGGTITGTAPVAFSGTVKSNGAATWVISPGTETDTFSGTFTTSGTGSGTVTSVTSVMTCGGTWSVKR